MHDRGGGMRGWGGMHGRSATKKRKFTVFRKQKKNEISLSTGNKKKTEVDCLPETEKNFHLIMMIVTHLIGALFSDVYFHSFNILIFPRSSLYWRPNGQVQLSYR